MAKVEEAILGHATQNVPMEALAELAYDVGFSSHSHMTEAFRRTLGVSPREIRADLRQSRLSRLKRRLRAMPG